MEHGADEPTRLETERLLLRRFSLEDVPSIVPIYTDPEVMRYVGRDPELTPAAVERGIRATLRRYEISGLGFLRLSRKPDDEVLGHCGLQEWDGTLMVELGYVLRRDAWGNGYATEASRAVIEHGFAVRGLRRIVAVAAPENRASTRVMERVGMRYVKHRDYKGVQVVMYAIDRPFPAKLAGDSRL